MSQLSHDGDQIDRLRKTPEHCLYCAARATSREHAVPQAIGGRLWAIILCPEHNRLIGTRADEPFIENAKPLVNFLRIRHQDGSEGVAFNGVTADGKTIRVTAGVSRVLTFK